MATPSEFSRAIERVLSHGPSAATPLARLAQEHREAPGIEATFAVLGRLGGEDSRTVLSEAVEDRAPHAASAALALGDLGDSRSLPLLEATATDRLSDPTLRAAACASLLRLGARQEVRPLTRAILLAGTPHGRDLEAQLGLPHRPRWAYERYLLQSALRDVAGTDFGLDTDAPWDALLACANRIDDWLSK